MGSLPLRIFSRAITARVGMGGRLSQLPKVDFRGSTLRVTPLWARVDQNRVKLALFVVLFVVGSAVLIDTALIAVPGSLLSLAFAQDASRWFGVQWMVYVVGLGALFALGSLICAVQLSNAEHWVRSRFAGRDLAPGELPDLERALTDMALAAGMSAPPRLMVLEAPTDSINAMAIGTTRKAPVIGVTRRFCSDLTLDQQRAVIAALTARIVSGDIMFATALASLMGPLKAIREAHKTLGSGVATSTDGCAGPGCGDPGCTDVGCSDGCLDGFDSEGCGGLVAVVLFVMLVIAITYAAVVSAAWLVTLWGRLLNRTGYEKADAEGMLLLKDPEAMLGALRQAVTTSNAVGDGDRSYDGIFYAATSGTPAIERSERRRYDRLREVLGTDGLSAPPLG